MALIYGFSEGGGGVDFWFCDMLLRRDSLSVLAAHTVILTDHLLQTDSFLPCLYCKHMKNSVRLQETREIGRIRSCCLYMYYKYMDGF